MFGHAELEPLGKSEAHNPSNPQEDQPMTPQETQALAAEIAKAVKQAIQPEAPSAPAQVIEFEGDITNDEDLRKHEDKLFLASLDLSKAVDLAKLRKHVAKRKAEDALAKSAEGTNPNATEIAKLQAEIERLQKASGAPTQAADGAKPNVEQGPLQKSEKDAMTRGREAMRKSMAKLGIPCVGGKAK